MKHFTDLKAWTTGLLLTSKIYECTRTFPKEEIYGLTSQMRRASTSILANLAEGFGRFIWDDRAYRFTISRGECAELEALVHIAFTLTFLDER